METMGWRRTMDKYDDRFKLKWVELKSTINYGAFREGEATDAPTGKCYDCKHIIMCHNRAFFPHPR